MNYAEINFEVKGSIHIAPIHAHVVLGALTAILKDFAELERNATRTDRISTAITLKYLPVCDEDRITPQKEKK
jgi:hypothetical protein